MCFHGKLSKRQVQDASSSVALFVIRMLSKTFLHCILILFETFRTFEDRLLLVVHNKVLFGVKVVPNAMDLCTVC